MLNLGKKNLTILLALPYVAICLVPSLYLILKVVNGGLDLRSDDIGLIFNTLLLATGVVFVNFVFVLPYSFLIVRGKSRRVSRLLLLLGTMPLAFPSFILAYVYNKAFSVGGGLYLSLGFVLPLNDSWQGFWPALFVMSIVTFPYFLLPVAASVRRLQLPMEESARLLGAGNLKTFFSVIFPQIKLSVYSGAVISALYVVSDFGAMQILGYDTMARVIYVSRLFDQSRSFSIAFILMLIAWVFSFSRPNSPFKDLDKDHIVKLSSRIEMIFRVISGFVVLVTLVMPIYFLLDQVLDNLDKVSFFDLLKPLGNTVMLSLISCLLTLVSVGFLAYLTQKFSSFSVKILISIVYVGFALPGIVVALSLVEFVTSTSYMHFLYNNLFLVIFAYMIHFGAIALGSMEQSFASVPKQLDEVSQVLGVGWLTQLFKVRIPLMRSGVLYAFGLFILSSIKELPIALLLSPPGFRTLATEIWSAIEVASLARASYLSLFLVTFAGVICYLALYRTWINQNKLDS